LLNFCLGEDADGYGVIEGSNAALARPTTFFLQEDGGFDFAKQTPDHLIILPESSHFLKEKGSHNIRKHLRSFLQPYIYILAIQNFPNSNLPFFHVELAND
jgi:hypothetical protein